MSSRDLAIVQPPAGTRSFYCFTLRRNGTKPWPLLQWRHKDKRVTLRMPKTASLQESLAAFDIRVPWFEAFAARKNRPKQSPFIQLHGEPVTVVQSPHYEAKPQRIGNTLQVRSAPVADMQWAVGQYIWDETLKLITPLVKDKAAMLGVQPGQIWLSNAMRKWGACDRHNNVNFSWRLAMAPRDVQEYLAAHEVAHFKHKHHQHDFWAEVNSLMPGWAAPEHWLTFKGGALMAFHFEDVAPLPALEARHSAQPPHGAKYYAR
ncbi:MAG: M48 family metallopeptidase [Pseudomonadota bacterium]